RWKRFRNVSELRWKEQSLSQPLLERSPSPRSASNIGVRASGAIHIGYNGYLLEGNNRRIIFSGDTALSDSFAELHVFGPIDLAIMPIGAYNSWIHSHCTPEQAALAPISGPIPEDGNKRTLSGIKG